MDDTQTEETQATDGARPESKDSPKMRLGGWLFISFIALSVVIGLSAVIACVGFSFAIIQQDNKIEQRDTNAQTEAVEQAEAADIEILDEDSISTRGDSTEVKLIVNGRIVDGLVTVDDNDNVRIFRNDNGGEFVEVKPTNK